MEARFETYLVSLGMTRPLIGRVEQIYNFYNDNICPNQITDLFVSEYVNSDGVRDYETLTFFSALYVMEASQFVHEDSFDVTVLRNHVIYFVIRKQDYDYNIATDASRMSVFYTVRPQLSAELKASRENCDRLRDIVRKYLAPNMADD